MRPVDSFLRSVRVAFHPSDETPVWVWIAIVFCLCSVIGGALLRSRRRRLEEEGAFRRFLAERKVSAAQAALIEQLAALVAVPRQTVATHIDVFERATALALEKEKQKEAPTMATAAAPPTSAAAGGVAGGDGGLPEQIAALRQALGFQRIAGHFALLTTRELGVGQVVQVAAASATVVEVTEAHFGVAVPPGSPLAIGAVGSKVRVTLVHGQEARYETRCVLLSRQPSEGGHRLLFCHDEQPTRIQLRNAVRVTVRGPVHLNPLGVAPPVRPPTGAFPKVTVDMAEGDGRLAPKPVDEIVPPVSASGGAPGNEGGGAGAGSADETQDNGSLIDISVGGAAIDATVHVPVGSLVHLSFDLDGASYRDLLALVLECTPRARGIHHMRLQFRSLAQPDEQKLAASVARFSVKPAAQQT